MSMSSISWLFTGGQQFVLLQAFGELAVAACGRVSQQHTRLDKGRTYVLLQTWSYLNLFVKDPVFVVVKKRKGALVQRSDLQGDGNEALYG